MDGSTTIELLKQQVATFCTVRDWDQFHTATQLSIGIVTEASELLELFRFKTDVESRALIENSPTRVKVEAELADVLFFVLRFAQMNKIDLAGALQAKLMENEKKYPVALSRGKNLKYDQL